MGSFQSVVQTLEVYGVIAPPIRVANLPAASRLRIAGMGFVAFGGTIPLAYCMQIDNCAGRVELNEIMLFGGFLPALPAGASGAILHVHDCAQVVASDVRTGSGLYTQPFIAPGSAAPRHALAGVLVENSALWMMNCSADGNAIQQPGTGFGGAGGAGMIAVGSTVHLGRSLVRGGQSGGFQNGVLGQGGNGLEATGSTILIHGGGGNAVSGAAAHEHVEGAAVGIGSAGTGITLDAASSLVFGSDVAITGGAGTASLPAKPPIGASAGAVVNSLGQRLPTVSITPSIVHLGATLTLLVEGEPGLDVIRAVALQTAPAISLSGVSGSLLIDLPSVVIWHVDTLGPTGALTRSVTAPADPALVGIEIVEQAAQVLASGITISPPVLISIQA